MLSVAHRYADLFETKCIDDGINPQLVSAWQKVIRLAYEGKRKQLQ